MADGEYIHERPDWPQFRWNAATIAPVLGHVRHRQGRLVGRMDGLGFKLRAEAALDTISQEIVKSSEIEREILNEQEVRSSVARRLGLDVGGLVTAGRDVEGFVEMMLDATQRHDARLTAERLFDWQAALFPTGRSGMWKIAVGRWRDDAKGPMQVVSGGKREIVHFQAPAAARVDGEMAAFLEWFEGEDGIDAVVRAAIAHLWFVTIHPFEDGNGRIARAVAEMALARSDGSAQRFYSMSTQIKAEQAAYYAVLEQTQRGDLDITEWLLWFLACLGRAIATAETRLDSVVGKARFWQTNAELALNDRQRKIINRLLDGFEGKLTSSKWAKIAGVSQDTAGRDIADLLRRGLLLKEPGGGRSTSYRLVETKPADAQRGNALHSRRRISFPSC